MAQDPLPATDVVVALAGCQDPDGVRQAVEAVRAGVHLVRPALRSIVLTTDIGWEEPTDDAAAALSTIPVSFGAMSRVPMLSSPAQDPYRVLFNTSQRAQACAALLLGSSSCDITPEIVQALLAPIVEKPFDIVAPLYVRRVFDSLINSAILYPLTRALYGKRIEGQLGLDFAFSARVAGRWGTDADSPIKATRTAWILSQAVCDGWQVCESHLPVRLAAPPDTGDLSTALAQILGPLFLDMEPHAAVWQRVQRSHAVTVFGDPQPTPGEDDPVDVRPMIDSFRLAYRNLQDIWALVLPPAALIELQRLAAQPPESFRMSDNLWARIVFDFALGHRVRAISRDHLLRALTPAYLAWVASWAIEMRGAGRAAVDARLERLCLAFEAEKPYLVRRWRWPDRFNP
jgi:hypothetical protein